MEIYRILVVDDEPDLCEGLKLNLEIEGYEADTAYSAEEALEKDLTSYNLILLDVMMGKMSGFEMARVLKRNPATSSIPVIFCTAKSSDDDMISGLNLGADDYVTKPYNIRNILARIKSVLRRTKMQVRQLPCSRRRSPSRSVSSGKTVSWWISTRWYALSMEIPCVCPARSSNSFRCLCPTPARSSLATIFCRKCGLTRWW